MSRLINPGMGEVCDRLTILALKLLHGEAAGRAVDHFKREQAALLTKVRAATLNGAWFEHVLTLGAVNAALWQATDRLRAHADADGPCHAEYWEAVGMLGLTILRLNDQRASLVRQINELAGEPEWQEKL